MTLGLLIAVALAQPVSSEYGFESHAGLFGGSGTPDFQCGEHGENPTDGGWGDGARYCLIETHMAEEFSGDHGDLTVAAKYPRYAGILLGVVNPYFGGHPIFSVGWGGDVYASGSYWAAQNGGGLRNAWTYAAIYAHSGDPKVVPDVIVGPTAEHSSLGFNFGVWTGYEWTFRVRDDGAIALGDQVLKVSTNNDALYLTQELPDGGTRTALLRWQ
jgi:hypothetical protein